MQRSTRKNIPIRNIKDFSEEEVKKAIEQGFKPISLGKSRLRTETAALVACHTLNLQNQ